jgi:hypothetical protein
MDFLIAVEQYEKCPQEDAEFSAGCLISTFIAPNAKKQINVSNQARKSLMRDLDTKLMTSSCKDQAFSKLKTRVKIQLQEEKVPQFLKSAIYQQHEQSKSKVNGIKKIRYSCSLKPTKANSCNWFSKIGKILSMRKAEKY